MVKLRLLRKVARIRQVGLINHKGQHMREVGGSEAGRWSRDDRGSGQSVAGP